MNTVQFQYYVLWCCRVNKERVLYYITSSVLCSRHECGIKEETFFHDRSTIAANDALDASKELSSSSVISLLPLFPSPSSQLAAEGVVLLDEWSTWKCLYTSMGVRYLARIWLVNVFDGSKWHPSSSTSMNATCRWNGLIFPFLSLHVTSLHSYNSEHVFFMSLLHLSQGLIPVCTYEEVARVSDSGGFVPNQCGNI